MAKSENKRIVKLNQGSWATFMGTFAGVLGLGVAILRSLDRTVEVAAETQSVLAGMAFGLAAGAVSIIVLPLIYFAIGWVLGYLQAWVYNVILGAAGGVLFTLEDE